MISRDKRATKLAGDRPRSGGAATLACWLAAAGGTWAQDAPPPSPALPESPRALQTGDANRTDWTVLPEGSSAAPTDSYPLRWGPIRARPHLDYLFVYGDGVPSRPGRTLTTVVNQFSPGVLFEVGRHWVLDYTPILKFYSNKEFRDTLDHSVVLRGNTTYEDWRFGLVQGYRSASDPLIETSRQTDLQDFTTGINAAHFLNSKVSLTLGVNQNIRLAEQFTSSTEWSVGDWLDYHFGPGLTLGLGCGVGYVDVDEGSNMAYEQVQGRIDLRATEKFSFQFQAGGEARQFLDSDEPTLFNPIFSGRMKYVPFELTTLSLWAKRNVSVSYFENQVYESTELGGGLRQRLLQSFYLDLSGGYRLVKFVATAAQTAVDREDNHTFFRVGLSRSFLKNGTLTAFYHFSNNDSKQNDFSYSSSQVGFAIGYRF